MASGGNGPRGRVVMIVDTTVDGDSRVQKSARSVAAAGWEVTLIGRAPTRGADEYRIGDAVVRRVEVPYTLHGSLRRAPRRGLRYRPAYRTQDALSIRARRLDMRARDLADERHRRSSDASRLARLRMAIGGARFGAARFVHRGRALFYRKAVHHMMDDERMSVRVRTALWPRILGGSSWRRLEPLLADYEDVYAPLIAQIQPDVIHAHDFRMVGIGVRAARRLRAEGREVRVIYDAHEFLPGVSRQSRRWHVAYEAYESAHIHAADAVITVSEPLADMLVERHGLSVRPTVVLNAPPAPDPHRPPPGDVRSSLGLGSQTPLLVYIGGTSRQRGIMTIVEALPLLAGVHVVLLSRRNPFVEELERRSGDLGVADRLHLLPYVDADDVVTFISTATVGVHPLLHELDGYPLVNHEVALATKLFDYAHARLPIVVSDVRTMAETVRATGVGEVFTAGDAEDLARAVRAVLADPQAYRTALEAPGLLDSWSWEAQACTLVELYDGLDGAVAASPSTARRTARPRVLTRVLTHPAMLHSRAGRATWTALVTARVIPETRRLKLARLGASSLREVDEPGRAAALLSAAAAHTRSPEGRAEAASASNLLSLSLGEAPIDPMGTVAALLRVADDALAAGRPAVAAKHAVTASEIAFHRSLHFDAPASPLAADPDAFLAAWRASTTAARLGRRSGRRVQAAVARRGAPRRLLFLTYANANFLTGVIDHFGAQPDIECRFVDLAKMVPDGIPLAPAQLVTARITGPDDARLQTWAAPLAEHLDWADTVWVEWCLRTAALVTMLDPGQARVIVRLHSQEAFTVFPHLVDFSRVDDVVFVAGHLRELVRRVVPRLEDSTRTHVLPNFMRLEAFNIPKDDGARLTLGVVGVGGVAKDPIWAVDLLGRLRAQDSRYRLLLIGDPLPTQGHRGVRLYQQRLAERLAKPDVAGAVEQLGRRTDMPEALRAVGVVVSSSMREAAPLAVVEGAASAAVPVVRDWPLLAPYGGPRTIFPADWVVDDIDGAVGRVLAVTATTATWRAAGTEAAEHARKAFDWDARVAAQYESLLLDPGGQ